MLSAFGGNGHSGGGGAFGGTSPLQGSVSPNIGAQQTKSPNPWDLSGLDPMGGQADLLGNNLGMVSCCERPLCVWMELGWSNHYNPTLLPITFDF